MGMPKWPLDSVLALVKNYINSNPNPATVYVIDLTKYSFTQSLSIKEIIDELEISKFDLELHLKRQPTSCFVNNYFDNGKKAWQANMDMQSVFNEYKAETCLCQCFSKTKDQCSQAMKQPAK